MFAASLFLLGRGTNERYIIIQQRPLQPSACVAPFWDFGVDSPALRLFLSDHIPGVCFKSELPSSDSYCFPEHGKVRELPKEIRSPEDGAEELSATF